MSKTLYKITSETVDQFRPFAEQMISEGKTQEEIERTFSTFLALKAKKTFKKPGIQPIKQTLAKLTSAERRKSDSVSELVLFDLLKAAGIRFVFQKAIGPYRVDFLIGSLVVELDGPHHQLKVERDKKRDAYLDRFGYKIMRIPTMILATTPGAVVEAIIEKQEER